MRGRRTAAYRSRPLHSETELIWNDRQYAKNKKVFGDNQILGWHGQFGFDRDDEVNMKKNYYSAFKKFNTPPELGLSQKHKRTRTAAGNRTKYKEIVADESVNPVNFVQTTPKFIPARHKFMKDKGDQYASLYAQRLQNTATDSKHRLIQSLNARETKAQQVQQ